MSIHARSCTVHAEFGFQSMLVEDFAQFAELMVFERQVQAAITLLVLPRGQHVPQKHVRIVWQTSLTHDDGWGK